MRAPPLFLLSLGLGLCAALLVSCAPRPPLPAPTSARMEVPIVLFSTRWCPSCAETRDWLYGQSLIFEELDVSSSRAARSVHLRLNPRGTVPTVLIDGYVVVGHSPERMRELLDRAAWERVERRGPPR